MTDDWAGKRVTVMGLGLFSGGVAATRWFAERGAEVLVTDQRTREELAESVAQVEGPHVSFHLGGHRLEDFTDTDLVVANPAVSLDSEFLHAARGAGVPITSEMNLFFKACPAPVVGVTGSNGKSTAAALIAHILAAAGRPCRFGGNIGRSLLPKVHTISPDETVVLEISSFQLEYLDLDRLSPHVAVVLNLRPNHLDRHGTMENYAAAKRHILDHQKPGDVAVLNADDEWVSGMRPAEGTRRVLFSMRGAAGEGAWVEGDAVRCVLGGRESVVGRRKSVADWRKSVADWRESIAGWRESVVEGLERMKLLGRHNRENACAAVLVALVLGVEPPAVERALATFEPLPHRLQTAASSAGVTWVNDSIATNPDSVAAALDCFAGNVILIAGGSPKNIPYDAMIAPVVAKVKLLLLIGRTAPQIEAAVRAVSAERPEIVHAGTLERAVAVARERARPGDTVLLSPACASFDQFRNFAERGERFMRLVREQGSGRGD